MTGARSPRSRRPGLPGTPRLRAFDLALVATVLACGTLLYGLTSPATSHVERPSAPASTASSTTPYDWSLPERFPRPRVPKDNPMSDAKVELGRRLFYDKRLSANGTQSCGSCHLQSKAFTDGRALAVGSTGEVHPRNTQSLVNVAYMQTLTWANPALVRLEQQAEVPLFGKRPVELGLTDRTKDAVLSRLRREPMYRQRFREAFPEIKTAGWTQVMQAIGAFQRTIVSARSRYDRYLAGNARLNASERRGMNLFMGERAECHHCHGSFIFNDQVTYTGSATEQPSFHNTGLFNIGGTGAFPEPNRGVFELTGKPEDMGRFRAPSLRNVELTAPYMHDGSIATLEAAVAHYARGGRLIPDGPNAGDGALSPLRDPEIGNLTLSAQDQADLVAFLRTLTDRAVTRDERFADPFAKRRATTPRRTSP